MDKVKVSTEVSKAIDYIRNSSLTDMGIIEIHATKPNGWGSKVTALNNFCLDTLIRALYIGYEVEQTPEDKVREYFNDPLINSKKSGVIIVDVLDLLNIKIEGVNA